MTTITTTQNKITLFGEDIKKLKSMVKGWKRNNTIKVSDFIKFNVIESTVTATYYDHSNTLTVKATFNTLQDNNTFSFTFPVEQIKKLSSTKQSIHEFILHNTNELEHVEDGISQKYTVIDPTDYSTVNNEGYELIGELSHNTLQKLSQAVLSVGKSETRPILQYVVLMNGKIVATDSHRLYMSNSDLMYNHDILIHSNIIGLIDSLTDKEDSINVSIKRLSNDQYFLKLHNNHVTVYEETYKGNYPEVNMLVPEYFSTVIKVNEYNKFKKTLEAIKKLKDWNNATKVKFDYDNNKLYVSDMNEKVNTEINVTIKELDRNLDNIAFSATYMLDGFKQLKDDQIVIKFTGSVRPFIIQSENDTDTLCLQLPVKIK